MAESFKYPRTEVFRDQGLKCAIAEGLNKGSRDLEDEKGEGMNN